MATNYVTYEHPLNEKIRIFLRIEYIWYQLESALQMESDINCIVALNNLIQLLEINERYDLKSESLKFLDKLIMKFHKILSKPNIDINKGNEIICKLEVSSKGLQ